MPNWFALARWIVNPNTPERCPSCAREPLDCRCSQYCEACGGWTNHTTAMHRAAEARQEEP